MQSLYGVTGDAPVEFMSQLFGAALIGFAVLTWSARNAADSDARRAISPCAVRWLCSWLRGGSDGGASRVYESYELDNRGHLLVFYHMLRVFPVFLSQSNVRNSHSKKYGINIR